MARKQRIIGYVIINQAEGGSHAAPQLFATQAEAETLAKRMNEKYSTTRFAVRPIYPE
jgi:hypothetical protein